MHRKQASLFKGERLEYCQVQTREFITLGQQLMAVVGVQLADAAAETPA